MNTGPTNIDAYLDVTAQVLGLTIDEASRPAVLQNLRGLLDAARAVAEFELPDDLEAGPVFHP